VIEPDPASEAPADFCARSILEVDFGVLARRGVRGVLLDVDNTLVAPGKNTLSHTVAEFLRSQRASSGIDEWLLASNARRDLSTIATAIGAEVAAPRLLLAKPRLSYFHRALAKLGLEASEAAMIGDKVLHDIAPAARLGLCTVLVRPQWPDQLSDRLFLRRRREARAEWVRLAWSG
jgi:putative phosphatase